MLHRGFFAMNRSTSSPCFVVIGWLALMLVGVIAGDFVEDLAFESPEAADLSGTGSFSEDPDEHLLMPSPRVASPGDVKVLQLAAHAEPHICSLEPFALHVGQSVPQYLKDSCKPRPPSSIQVLRI